MIKLLLKAIKPFRLVTQVAMVVLGAGLVQYVQALPFQTVVVEGGIFLILVSISIELLRLMVRLRDKHTWPEGMAFKEIRQTRWLIAISSAVLITVAVTLFINWMMTGVMWLGLVFLVIALLTMGGFYYLSESISSLKPYQVLFESFFYVTIPPAFAFFLQSDEMHLFLTLVVAALMPAYLAFRILIQLKRFGRDQNQGNRSLVMIIGWERGMTFHSVLILLTFVIFGITATLGLPWFILWPAFLALPIGILEIILMERVRRGGKPIWIVMEIASGAVFFLPVYFLSFAFWIR